MRTPVVAGNWKMNKSIDEATDIVMSFKPLVKDVGNVEIVIMPPFTALSVISPLLIGSNIKLGAQNMHFEDSGAFTGEISPAMLIDAGCKYVILGHSERRQLFFETNEFVNKKIKTALKYKMTPIICIGETLAQREENKTFEILEAQLKEGLTGISVEQSKELVIAYEPIWAIGTGRTATKEQAEQAHAFIRETLSFIFDKKAASLIRILYGGSVKPENVDELMAQEDIDGVLVGGASLNADSFARIVKFK